VTVGKTCRSCGALIVWGRTAAGKPIPLDAGVPWWILAGEGTDVGVCREGRVLRGAAVAPGTEGAVEVLTAHFATCPNAAQHRKRK